MHDRHNHKWEWDHENPHGFTCECGDYCNACLNCEEPSGHRDFCSMSCEVEYYDEGASDLSNDDEDLDQEFDRLDD